MKTASKNIILIEGIKCYCYHGCFAEEAVTGGNYIVDVTIETDFEKAASTDNLHETIDYAKVVEMVRRQMAIRSKLIEHVAKRIYDSLKTEFLEIKNLEIKVTKLNPPVEGGVEKVSVIIR